MKTPFAAGLAALATLGLGLGVAACGGGETVNAVTVDATGAAAGEINVGQGQAFTVTLKVSPEQAKKGVASWARDYDNATPLATEGAGTITGTPKEGLVVTFPFTAAEAGSADMGFRQVAIDATGATPLRQTATVHITVN